MRRRELLAALFVTTTVNALRAAEPNKVSRLAACIGEPDPLSNYVWSTFFGRLRQLGYIEGKNLIVDRYAAGKPERYAEIATNMVQALHPSNLKNLKR